VLAFHALPIVPVMSVLTTLLFYWRILPPRFLLGAAT
jgi:CNT family concentrative nucleoside transporter